MTAAVLVMSTAAYSGWQTYRRHADARWLEGTAVPQITTLLTVAQFMPPSLRAKRRGVVRVTPSATL
jgi:hypothetical protein